MSRRPEHMAPPEIHYGETEARKYTGNTRTMFIQRVMTERALELLALPDDRPHFLLDIGCGSGLSGEVITEAGHLWAGFDISPHMLNVAREGDAAGDLFLHDIGEGITFRPGSFDGAISISVIQWLCNQDKTTNYPRVRLKRFFSSLYVSLCRGARAVFQFYPESTAQVEMIVSAALRSGFTGGLVVDYPNSSKAKKYYLCLFAGYADNPKASPKVPQGLTDAAGGVRYDEGSTARYESKKGGVARGGKEWIKKKKDQRKMRGLSTAADSKYTGRSRRPKF